MPAVSSRRFQVICLVFVVVCSSFWYEYTNLLPVLNEEFQDQSKDNEQKTISDSFLQQRFPECTADSNASFNVSSGMYVVSSKTTRLPRYDHQTCFLMKARYNCAYRPDNINVTLASDYQYVWKQQQRHSSQTACNLRNVIQEIGGPQGISKRLAGRQTNNHGRRPFHVLLQGSSFARQIFEALVCGFQDQITDFRVQVGGPSVSLSDFLRRGDNTLVAIRELGKSMGLQEARQGGCHGEAGGIQKYYRRRATKPPNIPNCNDNIGLVEFGNSIRFYYIFRPTMYDQETLHHIYKVILGIPDDGLDVVVWNHVLKEPQNTTLLPAKRQIPVESLLWKLRGLQLRDLGRYFGANNPWIKNPPDFHPCMPGVPDDEVNILLFLLLTGKRL